MILTSKNNPLIKETVALKERKGRKQLGLFLVEGVKMCKECVSCGFEIDKIFLAEGYEGENAWLGGLEDKTVRVSNDVFRHLSDEKTPQGVLCRAKIPVLPLSAPKNSCIFLDGVADPGNVGAIIRTANAAGYKEIYLTRECADAYSPKSVRASMSGIFFTDVYVGERAEILSLFKGENVLVGDMAGENVFTFNSPEKFVLVIGNEGNGVSRETRTLATHMVKIPMSDTQESLNASVSAGILMYLLKKNTFRK